MSLDIYLETENGELIHDQNITHNLGRMAEEGGFYGVLWHPEENGVTKASDLIEPLYNGICAMLKEPKRFEAHNASNGWGLYENFLPWLIRLLRACQDNPECKVSVSR